MAMIFRLKAQTQVWSLNFELLEVMTLLKNKTHFLIEFPCINMKID
jgi:hypothetical protein